MEADDVRRAAMTHLSDQRQAQRLAGRRREPWLLRGYLIAAASLVVLLLSPWPWLSLAALAAGVAGTVIAACAGAFMLTRERRELRAHRARIREVHRRQAEADKPGEP